MYIYGISIGMDFRDIAKLLMSDTGDVLVSILSDNVFTQSNGYFKASQAFGYFDKCPFRDLNEFNIYRDTKGNEIGNSPLKVFEEAFLQQNTWLKDKYGAPLKLNVALARYAKSKQPIDVKLNKIESLRKSYNSPSSYATQIYNKLLDYVENYINQLHKTDKQTVAELKILAEGADEMRIMGSIFSLNQGIDTDLDGFLHQVNLIERAIYDRKDKKSRSENDIIDIVKFVSDEKYRQECILKYDKVKHSFNILEAVSTTPHFMGYVRTLVTALQENMQSFKTRSVKNLSLKIAIDLDISSGEAKIIKGIQNYVGDYLRREWMLQEGLTIIIPKGNKAFDNKGNEYTLEVDTPIRLGTYWGDATFRMFMERQIIPDLKAGRIIPGEEFSGVSENKFIKDLGNDLLTNTVSKNPSIIYTLPINMLPRTDTDRNTLDQYRTEFGKLATWNYQYNVSEYTNEDGTKINSKSYKITDLFTYYAMIANSWKLGENSLVPILADFQNKGIIKDFHTFVANMDKSQTVLEYTTQLQKEILPYVAPFQSPYKYKATNIWYRNPETRKMQLMERTSSDYSGSYIEGDFGDYTQKNSNSIGKYEFMSSNLDTNYFTSGSIGSPTQIINYSYMDGDNEIPIHIKYDIETDKLIQVLSGSTVIKMDDDNVPYIKLNGLRVVDKEFIEGIVKNQLNGCN